MDDDKAWFFASLDLDYCQYLKMQIMSPYLLVSTKPSESVVDIVTVITLVAILNAAAVVVANLMVMLTSLLLLSTKAIGHNS